MKLLFRPDPFVDKKGERIELEDIEIEEVYSAYNNYITFRINDEYIIDIKSVKDIQKEIEELYNYGAKKLFKRKENKFEKLWKTKQTVDLGIAVPHSNVHSALDMINEEDIQAPTAPTRPQIYLDLNDDGHKKMKMPDGSTFCITCSKLE